MAVREEHQKDAAGREREEAKHHRTAFSDFVRDVAVKQRRRDRGPGNQRRDEARVRPRDAADFLEIHREPRAHHEEPIEAAENEKVREKEVTVLQEIRELRLRGGGGLGLALRFLHEDEDPEAHKDRGNREDVERKPPAAIHVKRDVA